MEKLAAKDPAKANYLNTYSSAQNSKAFGLGIADSYSNLKNTKGKFTPSSKAVYAASPTEAGNTNNYNLPSDRGYIKSNSKAKISVTSKKDGKNVNRINDFYLRNFNS